jgi:hypothetical protein
MGHGFRRLGQGKAEGLRQCHRNSARCRQPGDSSAATISAWWPIRIGAFISGVFGPAPSCTGLWSCRGAPLPPRGRRSIFSGQIYHRIDHHLFFRFGEMYLKACVHEYKKSKTAQSCYQALEQAVIEGYTGSAGTSIPTEEEVELIQLKRLAY